MADLKKNLFDIEKLSEAKEIQAFEFNRRRNLEKIIGYIKDKNFVIEKEQFHYLATVRRFSVGDEINIFDGLGNSYKARIDNIDKKSIHGTIISSKTLVLPNKKISLYTAIPKGERFDWLIEKASEIGFCFSLFYVSLPHKLGQSISYTSLVQDLPL